MQRLVTALLVVVLATLGVWTLRLRASRPDVGFSSLHRTALTALEAGALDAPSRFERALSAAPPEVDRDLYARGIGWLRAGKRDLATAAFRESTHPLDFSP